MDPGLSVEKPFDSADGWVCAQCHALATFTIFTTQAAIQSAAPHNRAFSHTQAPPDDHGPKFFLLLNDHDLWLYLGTHEQ